MTKKEIIELEQSNTDKIHLFQEGSFWIAYERSAMRFVRSVRPYKVKKKVIKSLGASIASLGFPIPALEGIIAEAGPETIVSTDNRRIVLNTAMRETDAEFEEWKAGLETFVPKSKTATATTATPTETMNAYPNINAYDENHFVNRIRNFSVENSTPMECMNFVAEMRRQLTTITV
jgi:hypothetical protein